MSGNEAIAEAAIIAGVDAYFGYPITPQNEITAYMSKRMPEEGRVFLRLHGQTPPWWMLVPCRRTSLPCQPDQP